MTGRIRPTRGRASRYLPSRSGATARASNPEEASTWIRARAMFSTDRDKPKVRPRAAARRNFATRERPHTVHGWGRGRRRQPAASSGRNRGRARGVGEGGYSWAENPAVVGPPIAVRACSAEQRREVCGSNYELTRSAASREFALSVSSGRLFAPDGHLPPTVPHR